jgi:hypothetical protein
VFKKAPDSKTPVHPKMAMKIDQSNELAYSRRANALSEPARVAPGA